MDEICITVTIFRINRRKKGKKWMETAAFWVEIKGIRVQKRSMFNSVKKEKGISFLMRVFGIGYEVVESKLYHKNNYWLSGWSAYMEP
jgi:hypothetical protein